MSAQSSQDIPTFVTVENEGSALRVWYQGYGPLLILIPGGGGTGEGFDKAIPTLAQHYKAATYDRRGNGGSTVTKPRILNPMESARDVVAIIRALGHTRASLFGTSSGGLIALQLAQSYPDYVERLVVHETPIVSILPEESIARVDNAYAVFDTYIAKGAEAALRHFRSSITGKPEEVKMPENFTTQSEPPHRLEYFFRYELIMFVTYTPNLDLIRVSGVPIATVQGLESKGVFHATSAQVQSEILECLHLVWPGGHAPFSTHPEAFSEELHKTLHTLMPKGDRSIT